MLDFIKTNKRLVGVGVASLFILIVGVNHARAEAWNPTTVEIGDYLKPVDNKYKAISDKKFDRKVQRKAKRKAKRKMKRIATRSM